VSYGARLFWTLAFRPRRCFLHQSYRPIHHQDRCTDVSAQCVRQIVCATVAEMLYQRIEATDRVSSKPK
jgi:hypothetical protein